MKIQDLIEAGQVIKGDDWDSDTFELVYKKPRFFGLLGHKKIIHKTGSDWNDEQKDIILNSDLLERVKKVLDRLPVDIDYFVINRDLTKYTRDEHPESLKKLIATNKRKGSIVLILSGLDVEVLNDEGVIVMIKGKMTPWSFMHRFAHEIINYPRKGLEFDYVWHVFTKKVFGEMEKIISEMYGYNLWSAPTGFAADDGVFRQPPEIANFYNAFFTFGSARNNNLAVVDELMTESITQFLVTGKIRFQMPDEFHGHPLIGNKRKGQARLDRIAKVGEKAILTILKSMRNNVVVMS
jgi:hypothetical protein